MSDEGTCISPKMAQITIYEDRHGGHRIEVRSNKGPTIQAELGLEERTPLHLSAGLIGAILAASLGEEVCGVTQ